MLYLPPGTGVPTRVQGAFVSDQEVHKVVEYLKSQGIPDYREEVLAEPIKDLAEPIEDLADTDRGVLAPPPPKD
ncbi:MAG TPA: hypothetical protein VHH93_00865, partial [Gammaproteobacteria bacterium]|nr:hypothetical protein [Gammaproteobacteria bacterium]